MRVTFKFLLFLLIQPVAIYAQDSVDGIILQLRDSLDAIQYPVQVLQKSGKMNVITICNQKQWNALDSLLKEKLKEGELDIEIRVKGKYITFGEKPKEIMGLNYPHANIRIVGKKAKMHPFGVTFRRWDCKAKREGEFYSFPYSDFNLNDMVLDNHGNEIPIREEVKQVNGDIEQAKQVGEDVWRFRIDLQDLTEEQCKDFYVLMTRDWTSARHKVIKVQDGWLYYHLDSDDLHSDRNPNVDWMQYQVRPRYCLINCPISKGLHTANGKIYIPKHYKKIRVNKGGQLIVFAYCHFNSLEICGFKLNGCGRNSAIGIYSCSFDNGAFIHHNTFTNLSSKAIETAFSKNVTISDNSVTNTRIQAIAGGGTNTTISRNKLKNIGWMLNTRAITGGGERLHICDNVIEDFNYAAIACGSSVSNEKAPKLTYIIERNVVKYSQDYAAQYLSHTLADGGAIYIGPQCSQGIIRFNVVSDYIGIHSNRGIFLDDGVKNMAVYGNMVLNTRNCYDIDLRFSRNYQKGIPDHNTNNAVFHNIITGVYRFQDAGVSSNCIGGQNVLLGIGDYNNAIVGINNSVDDFIMNNVDLIEGRLAFEKNDEILNRVNPAKLLFDYIIIKK